MLPFLRQKGAERGVGIYSQDLCIFVFAEVIPGETIEICIAFIISDPQKK